MADQPADLHMVSKLPITLVPVRYTGTTRIYLRHNGARTYQAPDGSPLAAKKVSVRLNGQEYSQFFQVLEPGGLMLMPDVEALGQTWLSDPTQQRADLWLGAGWCVLPEHAGKTQAQMAGVIFTGPDNTPRVYRFEGGRTDFELVTLDADGTVIEPEAEADVASGDTPADDGAGTVVAALPAQTRVRRARTALDKSADDAAAQVAAGETLPIPEYRQPDPAPTPEPETPAEAAPDASAATE